MRQKIPEGVEVEPTPLAEAQIIAKEIDRQKRYEDPNSEEPFTAGRRNDLKFESLHHVPVYFIYFDFNCSGKNNSINARLRLILDEAALNSSTDNASVEWSCINKELTNKCLVYHNDQWFDFTVPKPGTYFLNVSSQECREKKGVQAVIIEGNPCEIKTYKILKCLSQIRQDDVFIRLDSLKPQITYLVNIDGFLGDFCDFKIQLSSRADGQPLETKRPASRKDQQRSIVRFEWTVSGERIEDIQKFKVYRRKSTSIKSVLVSEQYSMRNAYGFSIKVSTG